ncbi:MAG: hypothetical protein ACRDL4_09915, partial [Thermoleophilaceae bacterium]
APARATRALPGSSLSSAFRRISWNPVVNALKFGSTENTVARAARLVDRRGGAAQLLGVLREARYEPLS